jgi:hypothetical protein
MRTWGMFGGAILALSLARPAVAAQCASVSFSPSSVSIPNWNPIVPSAKEASFVMTVTRLNTATTGVRLIFLDSNDQTSVVRLGSDGQFSGPVYQVLDPSGQNILYPKNGTVASIKGQPAFTWQNKNSNNTTSLNLRVYVPANTGNADFPNGTYAETPSYQIQCLNNGNETNQIDTASGPAVSLVIPNLVSLTTAGAATLDFQNFTSLSQSISVGLKSTGPINAAIVSANAFKMARVGAAAPYPQNSSIDYELTLRGVRITPANTILTGQPRAGVAGTTWPLTMTLLSTSSGKVAGSYSDTITLTLTPGS